MTVQIDQVISFLFDEKWFSWSCERFVADLYHVAEQPHYIVGHSI